MTYRDDRDTARYRIDALEEKNRELNHELATERARRKQERRSVLPWILLGGLCASVVMGVAVSMATLAESSEGGSASTHRTPDNESLPELPARSDVIHALSTVQVLNAINACGHGEQGTTSVRITVEGSTGRVTEAVVTGQFTGTPVGTCIAHVVRDVSFPRFSRASIVINYPFRV